MKWDMKSMWHRLWQAELSPLARIAQAKYNLLQARLSVLAAAPKSIKQKFYIVGYEAGVGDQKYHGLDQDIRDLSDKQQKLAEQKGKNNKWGWWNELVDRLPAKWHKSLRVENEYDVALAESWELSQKIRATVLSFAEELYNKRQNNFGGKNGDLTNIISEMQELLKLVDGTDPLYHYIQGLISLKSASAITNSEITLRTAESHFAKCQPAEDNSDLLVLHAQDSKYFHTMAQLHCTEFKAKQQPAQVSATQLTEARKNAMTHLNQQSDYPPAYIQWQRLALATGTAIETPGAHLLVLKQYASKGHPLAWTVFGEILRHHPEVNSRRHYAEFDQATKQLGLGACVALSRELADERALATALEAHLEMNEALVSSIESMLMASELASVVTPAPMPQPKRGDSFPMVNFNWTRSNRTHSEADISTHSGTGMWSGLLRPNRKHSESEVRTQPVSPAQQGKPVKTLVKAITNMHATHDLETQDAVIAKITALQPQLGAQLQRYNFFMGASVPRVRATSESMHEHQPSSHQEPAAVAAHKLQPQAVCAKAMMCTDGLKHKPTANSARYTDLTQRAHQAAIKMSTAFDGARRPTRPWF